MYSCQEDRKIVFATLQTHLWLFPWLGWAVEGEHHRKLEVAIWMADNIVAEDAGLQAYNIRGLG